MEINDERRKISDQRRARAQAMFLCGYNTAQIADELNVVIKTAQDYVLPVRTDGRSKTKERQKRALALKAQGLDNEQISLRLGVTMRTVMIYVSGGPQRSKSEPKSRATIKQVHLCNNQSAVRGFDHEISVARTWGYA